MRRNWWIPPLAGLAILLTGIWGFNQYTGRRLWENRVETQYQRAFSELTNNLGGLETQLAKAAVSNSPTFLRQSMAEIWRQSYVAQDKLGQLPLGAVELTRMKMLLAKVSAFAFRVIDKPSDTLKLSETDWNTLQGFRDQTRYVSGQLTSMQSNILQNNLTWIDVERLSSGNLTAAALATRVGNNMVTKSLVMVEDGLKRMPDPGFPESAVIFKAEPKTLAREKKIGQAEGGQIAARFVGGTASASYLGRIDGDIPTLLYSVSDKSRGNDNPLKVSVTEQGGHVAWMLSERSFGDRSLTLERATEIAGNFVKDKGLPVMNVVSKEELGSVDCITLVPETGGVLRYPEMIKVQVAMDNGEVVGYEGLAYITFHDDAEAQADYRLTPQEAVQMASPHLEVASVRPTVILDDENKEVLAYELDGTMDKERFLVYIDAGSGQEIKIRRVDANGVEID